MFDQTEHGGDQTVRERLAADVWSLRVDNAMAVIVRPNPIIRDRTSHL
jgi:hypothetical protein